MINKFAEAYQNSGTVIWYATIGFTLILFGTLHILVEFLLGRRERGLQ